MASRRQADKYWFSVEGETEKWYLEWLRDVVNADLAGDEEGCLRR